MFPLLINTHDLLSEKLIIRPKPKLILLATSNDSPAWRNKIKAVYSAVAADAPDIKNLVSRSVLMIAILLLGIYYVITEPDY